MKKDIPIDSLEYFVFIFIMWKIQVGTNISVTSLSEVSNIAFWQNTDIHDLKA